MTTTGCDGLLEQVCADAKRCVMVEKEMLGAVEERAHAEESGLCGAWDFS